MHAYIAKEFILQTDASDVSCSAILRQEHRIISILCAKHNRAEKNYTTVEKELLAIIKWLQHFRQVILGQQIQILTDNKNLL